MSFILAVPPNGYMSPVSAYGDTPSSIKHGVPQKITIKSIFLRWCRRKYAVSYTGVPMKEKIMPCYHGGGPLRRIVCKIKHAVLLLARKTSA